MERRPLEPQQQREPLPFRRSVEQQATGMRLDLKNTYIRFENPNACRGCPHCLEGRPRFSVVPPNLRKLPGVQ